MSCNIFDHRNWLDEEAALTKYGRNELQVITDHFHTFLITVDVTLILHSVSGLN